MTAGSKGASQQRRRSVRRGLLAWLATMLILIAIDMLGIVGGDLRGVVTGVGWLVAIGFGLLAWSGRA